MPDRFTNGSEGGGSDAGAETLESDAGLAPDGGEGSATPGPFGIGDPWYFSAASEIEDFEVSDWQVISTTIWSDASVDVGSGHFKVSVPFTAPNQTTQFRITLPAFTDFTGRVLKVRVRRIAGAGQGAVQPFVQSTDALSWVVGGWHELKDVETLTELRLDFDSATNPALVKRFGIQIHSGVSAGDIQTNEIAFDDFRIE